MGWTGCFPRRDSEQVFQALFIQAANVILSVRTIRSGSASEHGYRTSPPRLHRNKLATALANKLARIMEHPAQREDLRRAPIRSDGNLKALPEFARDNAWNGSMNA